jgi:hypothetical protein
VFVNFPFFTFLSLSGQVLHHWRIQWAKVYPLSTTETTSLALKLIFAPFKATFGE